MMPIASSTIHTSVRRSSAGTTPNWTSIQTIVPSSNTTSTNPSAPSDTHAARRQNTHPTSSTTPTNALTASNVDRSRSAQSTYDHPDGFHVASTSNIASRMRTRTPIANYFTFAQ